MIYLSGSLDVLHVAGDEAWLVLIVGRHDDVGL